jgi:hypothetical protein
MLNPVPAPNTFMSARRSLENYHLRGFNQQTLKGLEYHTFFEQFHRKYFPIITEAPPSEILVNPVKHRYWLQQQKRYYDVDLDYWFPHRTELSLMTKQQRGRIDCLMLCPNREGFQLIDYKSRPSPTDETSLLFYVQLIKVYQQENNNGEHPIIEGEIIEAGCYYYDLGIEQKFDVTEQQLAEFLQEFQLVLTQIAEENFLFNSNNSIAGVASIRPFVILNKKDDKK